MIGKVLFLPAAPPYVRTPRVRPPAAERTPIRHGTGFCLQSRQKVVQQLLQNTTYYTKNTVRTVVRTPKTSIGMAQHVFFLFQKQEYIRAGSSDDSCINVHLALTKHDPLCPSVVRARQRPEPLLPSGVPDGHLYPLSSRVHHLHLRASKRCIGCIDVVKA